MNNYKYVDDISVHFYDNNGLWHCLYSPLIMKRIKRGESVTDLQKES